MPRDVEMKVEFCCPHCFGDSYNGSVRTGIYYCKGRSDRNCRFSFPFADMWKYSAQVTVVKFETEDEYKRALRGEAVC